MDLMGSICLFSSYVEGNELPYYVQFYLDKLLPYFSKVVLVTNANGLSEDSKAFLKHRNIEWLPVENEGWDFGMWFKAMKKMDVLGYDRLALVNDSCVLFKEPAQFFGWLEKTDAEYCGMVDSNAVSYHLQSFFIVAKKNAIPELNNYFMENGIQKDVRQVIETYEIGLSRHMREKGIKVAACYSVVEDYKGEFSPSFLMAEQLIRRGFPMIKKKLLFCSFRKDEWRTILRMNIELDPGTYIRKIRELNPGKELIDFEQLMQGHVIPVSKLLAYKVQAWAIQTLKRIKKFLD